MYAAARTTQLFLLMSMEYSSGPFEASFRKKKPFILPVVSTFCSPTGVAKELVLPQTNVILLANSLIRFRLFASIAWSQLKLAPAALKVPLPISTLWG